MKASDIKVTTLTTYSECIKAIEQIECDYNNVVGGQKAFFSGRQTELTETAKKKIAAIEKKMSTMIDDVEE